MSIARATYMVDSRLHGNDTHFMAWRGSHQGCGLFLLELVIILSCSGYKGRLNVIGALLVSGLLAVGLFSGSLNANTFSAWVEQDLLPKWSPHGVVVMNNAAFHKRAEIRQLFEQTGHVLEYLPPYLPELNSIERKWAQAKAIRRQKNCSVEERFVHDIL